MSNKQVVLSGIGAILLMAVVAITVSLTREPQEQRSSAQTSCQTPSQVQNVRVEYPNCQ